MFDYAALRNDIWSCFKAEAMGLKSVVISDEQQHEKGIMVKGVTAMNHM